MPKQLGRPISCPRPTYGRTLGGTLVGDVVNTAVALGGAFGGAAIASAGGVDAKRAAIGMGIGGFLGYLAGIPISMLADRAILRSPDCPNPGLGRLFGARLAKGAILGTATFAARRIEPTYAPPLVSVAGLFATVPLTQAIIRT